MGNPYQVIVDTFVESPFQRTALPQLVVASIEALPVVTELSQAVSVDILDTIKMLVSKKTHGTLRQPSG